MLSAGKSNREYFRQAYRSGRHGWAAEDPSPATVRFLKRLKRLVSGSARAKSGSAETQPGSAKAKSAHDETQPGGTLLDAGCGEGRHSVAAAQLGFKVTAIDYEPLALRRARRLARAKRAKGITFLKADVLHLPFPEACFDVVLDYGCLHHQRKCDWPAYKAGLLRVLRPGGYFMLCVFSRRFALFRGRRRPWHIAQGAYRRCFTRRDILGLFGDDLVVLELVEEKPKRRGFWHALMRGRGGTEQTRKAPGALPRRPGSRKGCRP